MVFYISILTYEFYHYALSRDMTHAARGFHVPCAKYCRPFDGLMMYIVDCEYHSHF